MPTLKLTKKYDRYPKYKDSGVKWVGEIPEGWGLMRVKYLAPIRDEKYVFPNDGTPYVGLEHVESQTGKHIEPDEPVVPESIVNRFEINDVLFGKLRPYLAKVLHASFEGYCTGELLVMVPGKIIPRYLYYKMLDPSFVNNVNVSTYGARMPRASWNFIGNQYFAYPDEQTQKNIAACLDEKTVLIDAIIEKKKKQIELLREKRAAIINRAVTKGLPARRSLGEGGDTNAKLVDSGIEWIGKIPEGWEVKKVKSILSLGYGKELKPGDRNDGGDYVIYGANGDVGRSNKYLFDQKSIVVGRKGSVGELNFVFQPFWPLDVTYYVTSHKGSDLKWIYYVLLASNVKDLSNGIKPGLSRRDIYNLFVPFVAKDEQEEIVDYIERSTVVIDNAVTKLQKSITLLQEFKSALISHVVTGKVKV